MTTRSETVTSAAEGDLSVAFRATMAHTPSAVSVVTTLADEEPFGTTVSDFISVSMTPPMLLVSLDMESTLLARVEVESVLGVNVLSVTQQALASRFAQKRSDKFAGISWSRRDGAPLLPGSHGWVVMSVTEFIPAGDHTLVLGAVHTAEHTTSQPLVYWHHTYGTHTAAGYG